MNSAPSTHKKKVLYLSGMQVHPPATGGFLHTSGISRVLARLGYSVRIWSLSGRADDYRERVAQRRCNAARVTELAPGLVEEVHLGFGIGVLQTVNRRLGFPRVWQYELLRRGLVPASLKRAIAEADILICDFPYTPPVPGPWRSKPWHLVSHNLEHRLLEQGNSRERHYADWMREIESRAPQVYAGIVACTTEDQAFFREHDPSGKLPVPIVGSLVDGALYRPKPGVRERMRAQLGLDEGDTVLIFGGSLSWQNVEALERTKAFAARERDWLQRNRIVFLLLGAMESQAYRDGPLLATGRVPDAVPYFAAADIGFNPVTKGSGANVKLYEYLAAGLPVVSTPFGVRGSGLQPERDYLAYDDESGLRGVLQRILSERSRSQWQAFAADVWQRHAADCDIEAAVRRAITQFPAFGFADGSKD